MCWKVFSNAFHSFLNWVGVITLGGSYAKVGVLDVDLHSSGKYSLVPIMVTLVLLILVLLWECCLSSYMVTLILFMCSCSLLGYSLVLTYMDILVSI